jgi:hypothetical protein
MWGLVISLVCLTGCDFLFQLEHLDGSDARGSGEMCLPPTGVPATKQLGARSGGVATATIDTFVSDDSAHLESNFGGVDKLFACNQCACDTDCESISATNDDDVRALVRFDLETEIPQCSKVMTATLLIDTTSDNLGGGSSMALYAVSEAWDEGTGPAIGGPGTANWIERKPGLPWLDGGVGPGSRSASKVGEFAPIDGNASYDVTIDAAAVQTWVDDRATNHGFVLLVTGSTSDVHFHSREASDPAKRPALRVTYTPP